MHLPTTIVKIFCHCGVCMLLCMSYVVVSIPTLHNIKTTGLILRVKRALTYWGNGHKTFVGVQQILWVYIKVTQGSPAEPWVKMK